jgi:HSP20 family protein
MNSEDQNWFNHLDNLDEHYSPDKFFADQDTRPSNDTNVKEHFFAPALTEEADLPEEAQLSIDIHQDADNLYVISPLAGADPATLDVSLDNDILTIRGQRDDFHSAKQEDYLYQECYWGKFSRSIILPLPVITNELTATLKNNVLTVKLPKAPEAKKVEIKVKSV